MSSALQAELETMSPWEVTETQAVAEAMWVSQRSKRAVRCLLMRVEKKTKANPLRQDLLSLVVGPFLEDKW